MVNNFSLGAPSGQAPKSWSAAPQAWALTATARAEPSTPAVMPFVIASSLESIAPNMDGELAHRGGPFDRASPRRRPEFPIANRVVSAPHHRSGSAARLDDLAQRAVQRLHRVGGVDHLADAGRNGEERHDVVPGPAPGRPDRRMALAPLGLELFEAEKLAAEALNTD